MEKPLGTEFTYKNPSNWVEQYPKSPGKMQSPIALFFHKNVLRSRSHTIYQQHCLMVAYAGGRYGGSRCQSHYDRIYPITFQYYDVPLTQPVKVTNNGYTVKAVIKSTIDGNRPSISGGGVEDIYEVENIHFHWGSPKKRGSEHTISGKKFDLEMHIVHRNSKYKTAEEALEDPSGLAVLGILFKAVKDKNINRTGVNEIYDVLPKLSNYNSTEYIDKTITMQSILGGLKIKQFFKYNGSLTTPPYPEAVTWFVFPDVLPIQTEDLTKFFTLYDSRDEPLLNNCRRIQKIRRRKVYFRQNDVSKPRGTC